MTLTLPLFDDLRRYSVPVFFEAIEEGWKVRFFGNISILDKGCLGIERRITFAEEFPTSIAFATAWRDLHEGKSPQKVRCDLENSINRKTYG